MRRSILAAAIAATAFLGFGSAEAGDAGSVLVVPLRGNLPGMSSSVGPRLTAAIKTAEAAGGAHVDVAQSSLDDLLMLNGCTLENDKCLRGVAETLGVDTLVLGELQARGDDRAAVTILRVSASGKTTRATHELERGNADAMSEALEAKLRPPGKRGGTGTSTAAGADFERPDPDTSTLDEGGGFSLSRVKTYTWLVTASGIAMAATGAVFIGRGADKQDEIDAAPTDTVDDLERLEKLEDSARKRFIIGDSLLVGGALTTGVGVLLIVLQGRSEPSDDGPVVAPLATPDSVGIGVSWSLP